MVSPKVERSWKPLWAAYETGKRLEIVYCSNWFINSPGSNNEGRLLTPEEGCGIQPQDTQILTQYHRMLQLFVLSIVDF